MIMMTRIEDFVIGALVHHYAYGYGQIIDLDADFEKCTILFEDGFKDRFTIQYLTKSDTFYILSKKRWRVSDLWD